MFPIGGVLTTDGFFFENGTDAFFENGLRKEERFVREITKANKFTYVGALTELVHGFPPSCR